MWSGEGDGQLDLLFFSFFYFSFIFLTNVTLLIADFPIFFFFLELDCRNLIAEKTGIEEKIVITEV